MHFVFSRAPFAAANGKTVGEVVEAELKKHSPFENFAKSLTNDMVEALQANTGKAIERAEAVMQDANKTGELNPSTEVHLLVKTLYGLEGK